ncbi:MAG TPA: DUF748 domain-containing protein [Verrucomicrobiae bacterium]|jgi:hypothetical protein|nr:DUF748 domain-containing protein [Verrucomicrobiae bacterium]
MSGNQQPGKHPRAKHHCLRKVGYVVLVLIIILGVARLMLPSFVRNYVNRTLDRGPLYTGNIGQIQIHLLRGSYSINEIRLNKTTGNVPVPFFSAKRLDFAIQWSALWHRKIVGRMFLEQPEINFVDASSDNDSQSGAGDPWLEMIRELFPFKINSAQINDGSVHFRAYQTAKPLDVYLSHLNGSIDNLSNVRDEVTPLNATVQASADAMDQAKLEFKMTLDPFSYRPTFHLGLRLLGLDVTKINDLALAYGKFDFKRGWFDLVLEADSQEGRMTGYVKPLFRDLKVFSITQDAKDDNPLQFFWQALVGFTTNILKNRPRDQFGTLIPFSADATSSTTTDIMATIGNLLRNAFVRAYLPRLENTPQSTGTIQFSAPDFTNNLTTSDAAQ